MQTLPARPRHLASTRRTIERRAHGAVDAAQVAARALRRRVVGGEEVERLGRDAARQGAAHRRPPRDRRLPADRAAAPVVLVTPATSSSAPWQAKPAPNDDSHHQPSGASSAIAASSTK